MAEVHVVNPPVVGAEISLKELTVKVLMGVLVAAVAAFLMPLPIMGGFGPANILGIAALAFVIVYQYRGTMNARAG